MTLCFMSCNGGSGPSDAGLDADLGGFCGFSTAGPCTTNADCYAGGCSGQVCQSIEEDPIITTCEWRKCYDDEAFGVNCGCVAGNCIWQRE